MIAPHITLRQLYVFATVARSGSTRAAGEKIGLSQSACSAALNELERLLGATLFDRNHKHLILNGMGLALLAHADEVLGGASDIESLNKGERTALSTLRIGASTTIGGYILPKLIKKHWGNWIESHLQSWGTKIIIGNTAIVCDLVAKFDLDLGLIEGPPTDSRLQTLPWISDELVIIAPPALAAKLRPDANGIISIKTLRDQVWLLREPGSGTRAVTDHQLLPRLVAFDRHIELSNSEAIKQAVAEGLGVACLSLYIVQDWIASGRLVRLKSELPVMQRHYHIVLHQKKRPGSALKLLIDNLKQGV